MPRKIRLLLRLAASGMFPLAAFLCGSPTTTLDLDRGDYVTFTARTAPGVPRELQLAGPQHEHIRTFAWEGGPKTFGFVAEASGTYTLGFAAPEPPAELAVGAIVPPAQQPTPDRCAVDLQSPRLQALRDAVEAGNATAEAAFWQAVAQQGAPLIEPKDEAHVWVTFLWHGDAQTRSVFLNWPVFSPRKEDNLFQQLPGTNVWYYTAEMPRGLRMTYKLAPNAPFGPGSTRQELRRAILAVTQADPLNPHRWPSAAALDRFEAHSCIDLTGAAPMWEQTDVPAGKLQTHWFESQLLGNRRDITLYTPAQAPEGGPEMPLLIVFDADRYLEQIPGPAILDHLIAEGQIPPTIAVFVSNPTSQSRSEELPANPVFAESLATELLPWLEHYCTFTDDPQQRVLAGASYGGLAASSVAFFQPAAFGAVLSQSGSYWWAPEGAEGPAGAESEPAWLNRQFAASDHRLIRFYLEAGTLETASDIRPTNRALRDILHAKGYDVTYREFAGGHDDYAWQFGFAQGLVALLGEAATAAD
ncbi:MAG: putative esterase [Puniceicoccaceae bacterium 5H]|nr:MAG: putative esterase [Puniceicoccaceae bacterium 5H]